MRRLFELYVDGRVEELKGLLDPDIDWLEPDEAPDRRVVKGVDEALDALGQWMDAWSGYEIAVDEIREASADHVFVAMRQKATGASSGAPFEGVLFWVFAMRSGRPARAEMFFDRAKALAAAGLSG